MVGSVLTFRDVTQTGDTRSIENVSDYLIPFDEVRDVFQLLGSGQIGKATTLYLETLPAVIGTTKLVSGLLGQVVKPQYAAPITTAVTNAAKWYSQPARALLSVTKSAATKIAPKMVASSFSASALAAPLALTAVGTAVQHGITRIPGVKQASWYDVVYGVISPTDKWTPDMKESKVSFNPLSMISGIALGTAIPTVLLATTKIIKGGM
jgi:hypothetical protein